MEAKQQSILATAMRSETRGVRRSSSIIPVQWFSMAHVFAAEWGRIALARKAYWKLRIVTKHCVAETNIICDNVALTQVSHLLTAIVFYGQMQAKKRI